MPFAFVIDATDPASGARAGRLSTAHGEVRTPVFMPVGTHGALKALTPAQVAETGAEIVLANTYHLTVSPGEALVQKHGGLHRFMAWDRALLTDSGGFQVFSLPKAAIGPDGVTFRHEAGGEPVTLTPERAIAIQEALGADCIMCFDDCAPWPCDRARAEAGVERTTAWARRCRDAQREGGRRRTGRLRLRRIGGPASRREDAGVRAEPAPSGGGERSGPPPAVVADQALFGIVQGSAWPELRRRSAEELVALEFPGYAIGGVSVGEGTSQMLEVVAGTAPLLPQRKPRYVMGVGKPEELLAAVALGIDMFDCVLPTRHGRGGTCYTARGPLRIRHRRYRLDRYPIDTSCDCYTCRTFTRAYVRHCFEAGEILGQVLASLHNVHFYVALMRRAREAIVAGRYAAWHAETTAGLAAAD